ncbi:hypothetical protein J6590_052043 [Homalodisca vitripennis]|nr:hypothetical protein J6590_052043 [Homalodisca vitripennis]
MNELTIDMHDQLLLMPSLLTDGSGTYFLRIVHLGCDATRTSEASTRPDAAMFGSGDGLAALTTGVRPHRCSTQRLADSSWGVQKRSCYSKSLLWILKEIF